jgi:medium-chain acyl-[acyl-carrier-protein] hydrolase
VVKVPEWVSSRDLQADGVRLFCLPHAGSGAAGFYRWKRLLPDWVAVCPVMLPGREVRLGERALLTVDQIVDGLHGAMQGALDRPYAIFGHSMGALLAYAWARRIAAEGLRGPEWLFVSGRNAPQRPFRHRGLHRLPDAEFLEELSVRYGGVPEGFLDDPELMELFLPILRADLTVVETYEHGAVNPLACPIDAFAGVEDRSVSDEGLAEWAAVTRGGFRIQRFAGEHFYHLGAGQRDLLAVLEGRLASVRQST